MSDVLERIKSEIEGNKIVLFMKGDADAPMCGFSAATVQVLKSLNAPFHAVNILANPDIRQALPEYSSWPTFPQLFINGQLIGGCDIVHEMRDSGELQKLIDAALNR